MAPRDGGDPVTHEYAVPVTARSGRARVAPATAALALALAVAGCSSGTAGGSAAPTSSTATASGPTAAAGSPEPSVAAAQASQEAAADPARATDASSGALAVALRAADLPAGWTVQANPVPDGALAQNPSLAGICGGSFPSEAHRTAKYPVTGLDPAGAAVLAGEAISYDSAASGAGALAQLRAAFAGCTDEDRTIVAPPRVAGLAPASLVVEYRVDGGLQLVVAQQRGAVLSVLIGEDAASETRAAQAVAGRLAALPAAAVGS